MAQLAESWFLANQLPSGLFRYAFDPLKNVSPRQNNAIRQLMASRLLSELSANDTTLHARNRLNLEYILGAWFRLNKDGSGFIFYNGKSKLGATAMALRALVYSPFFSDYSKKAHALAKGLVEQMNPNGSFRPFRFLLADTKRRERILKFYSGEAILALVEYAEKTYDPMMLEAAIIAQDYYLNLYVLKIDKNFSPVYVPWHTMSLSKLYHATGDARYARAVFQLNDRLLIVQDRKEAYGRFYKTEYAHYGPPHSSSDAIYTESLAYALSLALNLSDKDRALAYRNSIDASLKNLSSLQYAKPIFPNLIKYEAVRGAFRVSANKFMIRIDSVQHALDALRKIISIKFREKPQKPTRFR